MGPRPTSGLRLEAETGAVKPLRHLLLSVLAAHLSTGESSRVHELDRATVEVCLEAVRAGAHALRVHDVALLVGALHSERLARTRAAEHTT